MKLLTYGKQEQSGYTPVLLLVDNWDDTEDLKLCILASDRKRQSSLMVIILNSERTQFPAESSRSSRNLNVFITNKLSAKEQSLFSEKLQQLKKNHKKPETFYAFMIMTNNFSEDYIKKTSGAAWNEPEVQEKLLRVKGKSENGEIYVNYGGNLKMLVRPVYLGDIRSGYSREDVSFYLGFTMEGPVAYNIKYENDQ
ncbi:sterile alpha motif domain-containing protein 9-like protein [Lates japonicus]|uniref:Sterile alpha motif domain-containing protein 9-like protein n=1 Tax=Lates japonicus TaxID=270547 RepID=A0AAD3MPS8_LATJO|nr:sterile alpha motif domain-containing protein 9-like protein [Lates japonicus]